MKRVLVKNGQLCEWIIILATGVLLMNRVYAVMGPPASGKTSIVKALAPYGVAEIISHTTRKPKTGENDGVDYHFVSAEEFRKTELIERVTYDEQFYGISKAEVLTKSNQHTHSAVAVERKGLEQLRRLFGDRVVSIFIMVDEATILERTIQSGDTYETIRRRIEYAKDTGEFDNWQISDYVVKNTGSLDAALLQVLAVMGLAVPVTAATAPQI
jgi:guanylate kinase